MKIKKRIRNLVSGPWTYIKFIKRVNMTSHAYAKLVLSRNYGFLLNNVKISFYNSRKHDGHFKKLIGKKNSNHRSSLTKDELYTLYSSVVFTNAVEGDIAEVGVYRGGSAKLLCDSNRANKAIYLFDTFEGMPNEKVDGDKDAWKSVWKGRTTHMSTSEQFVRSYLSDYDNLYFIKGVFPESIEKYKKENLYNKKFCLVHLDVDLYQSTLDALKFFYPRLSPFGRIISHNYNLTYGKGGNTPGVKLAFEEYFKGKKCLLIEIAETQCMVVKPSCHDVITDTEI